MSLVPAIFIELNMIEKERSADFRRAVSHVIDAI